MKKVTVAKKNKTSLKRPFFRSIRCKTVSLEMRSCIILSHSKIDLTKLWKFYLLLKTKNKTQKHIGWGKDMAIQRVFTISSYHDPKTVREECMLTLI